jgi:hypothetical protein
LFSYEPKSIHTPAGVGAPNCAYSIIRHVVAAIFYLLNFQRVRVCHYANTSDQCENAWKALQALSELNITHTSSACLTASIIAQLG